MEYHHPLTGPSVEKEQSSQNIRANIALEQTRQRWEKG